MWIFFPFLLVQQKQKSTSNTNFSAIKMISNRAATQDTASVFISVHCCLLSHRCAEIEPYRRGSNGAASHTCSMGAKNIAFSHTDRMWLGGLFLKMTSMRPREVSAHIEIIVPHQSVLLLPVCSLLFRSYLKNSMKEKP